MKGAARIFLHSFHTQNRPQKKRSLCFPVNWAGTIYNSGAPVELASLNSFEKLENIVCNM